MKNKIMVLLAIIPIVMLFAILSMTTSVALSFDIPVESIKISTETVGGVLVIDMAELLDRYLDVEVVPIGAKNKGYIVEILTIDDEEACEIDIDEQSKIITPKSIGKVKVLVTSKDGGFQDSIIVLVISTKALDFKLSFSNENIKLKKGETTDFITTVLSGKLQFLSEIRPISSDSTVLYKVTNLIGGDTVGFQIDSLTGVARAKLSGDYIVTATVKDSLKDGVLVDIVKTVLVTVEKQSTESGITIEGLDDHTISVFPNTNKVEIVLESEDENVPNIFCDSQIFDDSQILPIGNKGFIISLAFKNAKLGDEIVLKIGYGSDSVANNSSKLYTLTVVFVDFELNISSKYSLDGGDRLYQKNNSIMQYSAECVPFSKDFRYEWSISNGWILSFSQFLNSNICEVSSLSECGEAKLTVKVFRNDTLLVEKEITIVVVESYTGIQFAEASKTWGISKTLAVGNKEIVANKYSDFDYELGLTLFKKTASTFDITDNILLTSSDDKIAILKIANGRAILHIVGSGRVTIKAEWKYASKFKESVLSSLTVDCVLDGVNIGLNNADNYANYLQLKKATEDGKQVVLFCNIMLGKSIYDGAGNRLSNASDILKSEVSELKTTADWTYYNNTKVGQPSIWYCIEFKNNLFGNGHELNADYVTNTLDGSNQLPSVAVFRGPLWFVRLEGVAAVMEQDNISFLVRSDGISIDNVTLKGCSDSSLMSDDGVSIDLAKLNYVGTTLEVMSNATISNSRISNGRTTVRVFGRDSIDKSTKVEAANERIDVLISSCIISNSREFLLKVGTNRIAKDTSYIGSGIEPSAEIITPLIGEKTPLGREGAIDSEYLKDTKFVSENVLTHVTLENSALTTSGLFSVGMQSCFGGLLLNDHFVLSFDGWNNVAGTSYPAVLKLKGDVRLYDWKPLNNIDSSTLIELENKDVADFLKLDIKKILEVVSKENGYENLFDVVNGKNYAHGGIAFYGGGKNYSMLDLSEYTQASLSQYRVNIGVLSKDNSTAVQGQMLPLAAGTENFRFFMFDKTSSFNYKAQKDCFDSGKAYNFVVPYHKPK